MATTHVAFSWAVNFKIVRRATARDVGLISILHRKTNFHEDKERPTVQVSLLYPQFSYLQTVLVKVYQDFLICLSFPFRSRSCPVPRRGERVKKGTVHPRNIAVIT